MKAKINNVTVEGTPEEITELIGLYNKSEPAETKEDLYKHIQELESNNSYLRDKLSRSKQYTGGIIENLTPTVENDTDELVVPINEVDPVLNFGFHPKCK